MKRVNVRTLRNTLSAVLAQVKRGESVEVLERRAPIARLVPIDRSEKRQKRELSPWLLELEKKGILELGHMQGVPEILSEGPIGPPDNGVLDELLEERRTGR